MPQSLPDDVNRWPTNPYEVLGISRDADTKTIKRAYAQLIRQFRPDQHPTGFQRIREAFEAVEQYAKFRTQFAQPESSESSHDSAEPVPATSSNECTTQLSSEIVEESLGRDSSNSQFAKPDRRPQNAWELAIAGDTHGAWRLLEAESANSAKYEHVALQRFWLAKLTPGLADRAPDDFLFEAAKKCGLMGQTWTMLLVEWSEDSERLLSPDVFELLASARIVERVIPLFVTRWRVAGRTRKWSLLESDLVELRKRLLPDHATTWLTILIEQMRLGVWRDDSSEAIIWLDTLITELAQLNDLQLKCSYQFDEAEQWHDLREERLGKSSSFTLAVQQLLWSITFEDHAQARLLQVEFAETWLSQSHIALFELDSLAMYRPISLLLLQHNFRWGGLYESCSLANEASSEFCRKTMIRLLGWILSADPEEARVQVADFCQKELMTTDEFCKLATQHCPPEWSFHIQFLTDRVAQDNVLQFLCQFRKAISFE